MISKKGQASIELILLLVVVLLLIQTIILPSRTAAEQSAIDTSSMVIVRSQAQKLANAIELVDSSAIGAKQTISLFIPGRAKIGCSGDEFTRNGIYYQVWPNQGLGVPEACKYDGDGNPTDPNEIIEASKRCTGGIVLSLQPPQNCADLFSNDAVLVTIDSSNPDLDTRRFVQAQISKTVDGVSVVFE